MELMPLSPDFKDFLELLNRLEVRYMVIGGWAVGLHGWPRATKDLDLWVAIDSANAEKIIQALNEFPGPGPIASDFFSDEVKNIYFMGVPPNRIDLISAIDGLEFEDCWPRAEVATYDGVEFPLISFGDLKEYKKASGRFRDLADLEDLERLPD